MKAALKLVGAEWVGSLSKVFSPGLWWIGLDYAPKHTTFGETSRWIRLRLRSRLQALGAFVIEPMRTGNSFSC